MSKIPVGVSSCLLGEPVRYDGGHKRDACIVETLGEHFEYHAFCPEFAIGLGVPRKPVRLQQDDGNAIRCVQADDPAIDHTRALDACLDRRRLEAARICGYILKSRSPSCGVGGVPVWNGEKVVAEGSGVFAAALMRSFPWLPVEEETRLGDPLLRERFKQRVFALWRSFAAGGNFPEIPGIQAG